MEPLMKSIQDSFYTRHYKKCYNISKDYLKDIIEINNTNIDITYYFIEILIELGLRRELVDILPMLNYEAILLYAIAGLSIIDSNLSKAYLQFKRIIKEYPTYIAAYIKIGEINLKQKNYMEAKQYLYKALRIDKNNYNIILLLAKYHRLENEYSISKYYLELIKERNLNDPYFYFESGLIEYKLKKYKISMYFFGKVHISFQNDLSEFDTNLRTDTLYYIGMCLLNLDEIDLAGKSLDFCINLNKWYEEAWLGKVDIHIKMGNLEEALNNLKWLLVNIESMDHIFLLKKMNHIENLIINKRNSKDYNFKTTEYNGLNENQLNMLDGTESITNKVIKRIKDSGFGYINNSKYSIFDFIRKLK